MAREIPMPRLSDTMEEGRVLQWYKQVGDSVKKGELLAEIETDKAVMELESVEEGTLLELLVAEGGAAPLGAPIALVGDESELGKQIAVPAQNAPATETVQPSVAGSDGSTQTKPASASRPADGSAAKDASVRIKASPLARRIAAEEGIDLLQVKGTGPSGALSKKTLKTRHAMPQWLTTPPPNQVPLRWHRSHACSPQLSGECLRARLQCRTST